MTELQTWLNGVADWYMEYGNFGLCHEHVHPRGTINENGCKAIMVTNTGTNMEFSASFPGETITCSRDYKKKADNNDAKDAV